MNFNDNGGGVKWNGEKAEKCDIGSRGWMAVSYVTRTIKSVEMFHGNGFRIMLSDIY